MKFQAFCKRLASQQGRELYTGSLLSLDPGQTTGWAYFRNCSLVESGQEPTPDVPAAARFFHDTYFLSVDCRPGQIVIEDYRIYSWRSEHHAWSDLLTNRIIGCVETLCVVGFDPEDPLPLTKQMAGKGKSFCTDKRLQEWGYYQKGRVHARDAIRHGCHYLAFGSGEKYAAQKRHRKATRGQNVG